MTLLDVLIIGAGPVGLFAAFNLRRQGVSVRIIGTVFIFIPCEKVNYFLVITNPPRLTPSRSARRTRARWPRRRPAAPYVGDLECPRLRLAADPDRLLEL
ncbi:hypothetical protein BC937DRAFT_90466 [Endogone sp. FLAS-F59071]|nr:hypothetical protein BC937DRAFT_90466 [Endogone sp. FLAS-F59071]|eukprot:RUS17067.1 hypothetical protein BC937DRAFT_90466 [Endogone sp. FLAS-F59071]